jgi:hypothetical protein
MSSVTTQSPAALGAEAPPPRFDFPTRLPPMLVKELRQGLRTRGFVGGLIVVQAVMLIVFIWGFAADAVGGGWQKISEGFFWTVLGAVLLVAAPMRALASLGPEIELRTMDLLLLTRLDAWRIVWGKWISLQMQTLLLLATMLPYAVVRYFFGEVDLVSDFGVIAAMLGGGALFTGAALWASGLPKAVRILVIIGMVVMGFQLIGIGFARSAFGGASFFFGGSRDPVFAALLLAWSGSVLLLYSLVLAARWIAPPAENHSGIPRLVPLALAWPVPLLVAWDHMDMAAGQAGLTVFVTAFVAAVEFSSQREPMAVHLRGWMARGPLRGFLGQMALPGWPSAAVWLAATLAIFGGGWCVADFLTGRDLESTKVLWLLALGWAGLVFPVQLVSLIPSARKTAGVLYFTLHGLLGIFAIIAGNDDLGRLAPPIMRVFDWISHSVPTTSFWHALVEWDRPEKLPMVEFGQALGVALTIILLLVLSRDYWLKVRLMRARGRAPE